MKIGIYGGTFDPIHLGHIGLARAAKERFCLDKIYFLPSGTSYMKTGVTDAKLRLEMVKLSLDEENGFEADDLEIVRGGASYSYETVSEYKKRFPSDELYFLIGEDSLRNMHLWKNVSVIFETATVLVAGRKKLADMDAKYDSGAGAERIIGELQKQYQAKILYFPFDMPVSSEEIRNQVKDGKDTSAWLPCKVAEYIAVHGIYERRP